MDQISPTMKSFFKSLLKAKQALDILSCLINLIWEELPNEGEPSQLRSLGDIAPYETVQILHDRNGGLNLDTIRDMYPVQVRQMFGVEGPIYQTPEISDALDAVQDELENIDATVGEIEQSHPVLWKKSNVLFMASAFFGFGVFLIESLEERIEAIHQNWLEARDYVNMPHPLTSIVREWLVEQTHRTIKTSTVDQANDLTPVPYLVPEVNRRKWEIEGSVDAIEVDGEPIITHIKQLPGTFSDDVKVLKPKGTQGELMPMPTQRNNMEIPIPLIAYQKYGKNLGSAIASDTAQLMTLAYAANEPLILSVEEGASLLARGEDGEFRPPRASDEQRFENAYACMQMAAWITDERGINRFYPLTACDRFSDTRVSIAAASWAKDRKAGRWTLTAGGGIAGQNRLKGDTHNNNVWRVITGVEYWLARERFSAKGPYAKISQALIPASGTTGPGNWYTLSWQELMMIAGDIWDQKDEAANKRAYKRFQKIREALTQHGYQVKKLHTPAEAGDTVEFLFEKKRGRGGAKVKVRATSRFVEGARKSKRKDWQTVNLSDWIGL